MSTPHNNAKFGEIAKTVIMPGDPKRAQLIAKKHLTDYKLVNDVRGILTYTGKYHDKDITIMASGMGMPSMGIYSYELFKFYDVENIIRIGSCGALSPELDLFDIILTKSVYTEGNFALSFASENCHIVNSSKKLDDRIIEAAKQLNRNIILGNTACNEVFDEYILELDQYMQRMPKDFKPIASEMEAFSLFYTAKKLNKNASCLMTVVDSVYKNTHATSQEREQNLDIMIQIALNSIQ